MLDLMLQAVSGGRRLVGEDASKILSAGGLLLLISLSGWLVIRDLLLALKIL